MTTGVEVDVNRFADRFRRLQRLWNVDKGDNMQCEAIAIRVGTTSDETIYARSTAFSSWLLGYEFPDTVIMFNQERLAIITSIKKAKLLEPLARKEANVEIFMREKESGKGQIVNTSAWEFVFGTLNRSPRIGGILKETPKGIITNEWWDFSSGKCEATDVSGLLCDVMIIKDDFECEFSRIAGIATTNLLKYMTGEILKTIDSNKKVSHSSIAEIIENIVEHSPQKFLTDKDFKHVEPELLDICYSPILQSGGKYSLKPSATSDDELIDKRGFIIYSGGLRYHSYCANMSRTLLIDETLDSESLIKFAFSLQEHLAHALRPGKQLSSIYESGIDFVRKQRPDLEGFLLNNFGYGIGLEFRIGEYTINSKCVRTVKKGMAFNLLVGFQGLNEGKAAVLVADTVLVEDNSTSFLTRGLRELHDLAFSFANAQKSNTMETESFIRTRSSRQNNSLSKDIGRDRRRREHQAALGQQRLKEALSRYVVSTESQTNKHTGLVVPRFESYRKEGLILKGGDNNGCGLAIDKKAESIILPVSGKAVPFHINAIKNLTKNEEGSFTYLRINFNPPGSAGRKSNGDNSSYSFIKGISIRFVDCFRAGEAFKSIQEMKKTAVERDVAIKNRAELVEQVMLQELVGRKPIRLKDVFVRPGLEGKRVPGDVEIHVNGLRWRSQLKSEHHIDMVFSNIKHLIYQPCDHEAIVVFHLHLHHPILIGKKKTKDLQFYREVLDSLIDETSGKRSRVIFGDEDEIEQEREERIRRSKLNEEFKKFAEQVVQASNRTLEIEIPFRDLGFQGVFSRQSILCQPTSECLIQVMEYPFMIITLNEVEVAFLERVVFGLKNFDLVFVFWDHGVPPIVITSIPMSQLEAVKDWLDSMDTYFVESKVNFNWLNIMKTVSEDPSGFYGMGGWTYLQPDEPSQGESNSDEQSSEYEPDEVVESEDDSYSEEESEASESESFTSEDDSAPDWDQLEEEARLDDDQHDKNVKSRRIISRK